MTKSNNNLSISKIRHSAAHLMAAAVLKLYPGSKLGTGPATEEGFFYDIQTPQPLTEKDLPKIEKEMQALIKAGHSFTCVTMSINEARERAQKAKQDYKVELIDGLEADGLKEVTYYETGDAFDDLCEGPHIESSKEVGAFKLLSVAGAYWKGDDQNPQMSRIYGTAFATAKELRVHLAMLEEAKKRDHKKLGVDLDLFMFSPLVGAGLPLWTPRGTTMRRVLDEFVWSLREPYGYERVEIPHITKKALYEKSGHWDKFGDDLFRIVTREDHEFAMKPMNCPHHTQIYARRPHSYRELPIRYANTTMVYRDEQSGELAGLARVRAITQDDAHVFCRYSQVKEEIKKIWDIVTTFYGAIGFETTVELSLSDPEQPDKYLGTKEIWAKAEAELRDIAKERGVKAAEVIGEAAFYGPKIDFIAKDSLGRRRQVATIQLDMNLPDRFDLSCTNEKGKPERIVMIHAAIMGSIERYLSIVIEHFAGAFPTWMAPMQVTVLPIGAGQAKAAESTLKELREAGVRAEINTDNSPIGKRIRAAEIMKVPYQLIIGEKEVAGDIVSVRKRGNGDQGTSTLSEFISKIKKEIDTKSLD